MIVDSILANELSDDKPARGSSLLGIWWKGDDDPWAEGKARVRPL